jgi:hypothetical protein
MDAEELVRREAEDCERAKRISLDEARALPELVKGAAVYFLWDGDELLYIGCSKNAWERVAQHGRARDYRSPSYTICVPFKRHTMLKCPQHAMFDIEMALIEKFGRPPHNRTTCKGFQSN